MDRLQLAKELALKAGKLAHSHSGEKLSVSFKDALQTDPVTNVDQECEALIVEMLTKYFPNDGVLGEEGGFYHESSPNFWVIDPLDGTQNYMHGLPLYCVSIAYVQNHIPEIGVIYAPVFDELFVAVRGKGSTLNGKSITVSHEMQEFSRHFGTSALSLAWLACGRISVYKAHELHPWDFAAGSLIVQEAKGVATTLQNTPLVFDQPQSLFAANRNLNPPFENLT